MVFQVSVHCHVVSMVFGVVSGNCFGILSVFSTLLCCCYGVLLNVLWASMVF